MKVAEKKFLHTQGAPWSFEETPDGQQNTVIVMDGFPICTVRGTDDMSCIDQEDVEALDIECIANAKLIAAAPDLLEALSELLKKLQYEALPLTNAYYFDKAKEAIYKATQ